MADFSVTPTKTGAPTLHSVAWVQRRSRRNVFGRRQSCGSGLHCPDPPHVSKRLGSGGRRACIVALPPSDQVSASPRYDGSLRDAVHTGRSRDQLGSCISNFDWDGGLITCTQPHVLEVMG